MLLQDSLGGDAKALMFCNIAPVALHAGDTFSSLNFASKVRMLCLLSDVAWLPAATTLGPDAAAFLLIINIFCMLHIIQG